MSPGSMEDVVFILHVKRSERGFESRVSSFDSPKVLLSAKWRILIGKTVQLTTKIYTKSFSKTLTLATLTCHLLPLHLEPSKKQSEQRIITLWFSDALCCLNCLGVILSHTYHSATKQNRSKRICSNRTHNKCSNVCETGNGKSEYFDWVIQKRSTSNESSNINIKF